MDYQVKVNILRFNGTPDGNARLLVHWTIFEGKSREVLEMNLSDFMQPADLQDPESLVSAMSKLLENLSQEIATAIKAIAES
jgi:uncharacterized lipoprotein YmbA